MQVVSQALLKSQQRNLVMSECVQVYALASGILQFKTLKRNNNDIWKKFSIVLRL